MRHGWTYAALGLLFGLTDRWVAKICDELIPSFGEIGYFTCNSAHLPESLYEESMPEVFKTMVSPTLAALVMQRTSSLIPTGKPLAVRGSIQQQDESYDGVVAQPSAPAVARPAGFAAGVFAAMVHDFAMLTAVDV